MLLSALKPHCCLLEERIAYTKGVLQPSIPKEWDSFAQKQATMNKHAQGAKEEMKSAGYEGVLLGGNYVAGVALGKCVEYAYEYANQIEKYLQNKQSTVGIETTAKQDEPFFV